jgi:hypothetical protein
MTIFELLINTNIAWNDPFFVDKLYRESSIEFFIRIYSSNEPVNDVIPLNLKTRLV